MLNNLIGGALAMFAGAALAAATVFGVVYTQTSGPERSPADADQPFVDYGSTQ
ncbi:DUF2613 family protein [Nocardioides coralli]|uniref:DUF2613 family protein n=1 Tax=Nocardioides coralli TaxID=2872154 RepID=UPI001CA38E98|nr:DUF2613 family protein [Nocardioides coralli]QZY27905.1 DUF2613 family protein [Nocardioides coralli]